MRLHHGAEAERAASGRVWSQRGQRGGRALLALGGARLGTALGGFILALGESRDRHHCTPFSDNSARSQSGRAARSLPWVTVSPGIRALHPRVAPTAPGPFTARRNHRAALAEADESVRGCHRRYGWAASAGGERHADTADVEGASAFPTPD